MKVDHEVLRSLMFELEDLRESALELENLHERDLVGLTPDARESARNLIHYLALRRRDNRGLQRRLAAIGLSSLGSAESSVLTRLGAVLSLLYPLLGSAPRRNGGPGRPLAFDDGRRLLELRTEALLGPRRLRPGGRCGAHIMVTMPGEAAQDPDLVRRLVEGGMDCMRLNCAHDDRSVWARILEHLDHARRETGKECRVLMDLAGPKLRTGAIEPGPRAVHWQPRRDALGNIVAPALVWLTPDSSPEPAPPDASATVPVDPSWLSGLEAGDVIEFDDLRGKRREMTVRAASGASRWAESLQWTYLGHETALEARKTEACNRTRSAEITRPERLEPREQSIHLRSGDTLLLTRSQEPGRPVLRGLDGRLVEEPRIPCTLPEVFASVTEGAWIWLDDGKIGGVVVSVSAEALRMRVTHCAREGKSLHADRGINLPDSRLDLPALTAKDLEDLDFAVQHADLLGLSFVRRPEDVDALRREVARRTTRPLGIVLKIETRRAFNALPRILLAALRCPRAGVMIARGDLAVECGYERLAELQEEILWLCEAAHLPAIWATQVLESMNKKGYPTRAEVTDAAMAERAECVMLNKGPHVVEAVRVLDDILARMEAHQDKRSPLLRPLSISRLGEPVVSPPAPLRTVRVQGSGERESCTVESRN
jgi:pyruvate kinase